MNSAFDSRNSDKDNYTFRSKNNESSLINSKENDNSSFGEDKTSSFNKLDSWEKRFGALERRYDKRSKEYEATSQKYNALYDRMENLEKNFKHIIHLIENGLTILSEDESIKGKNEFFIDINNLKDVNFDDLPSEKKYILLCILMKNFSTILNVELLGNHDRKKNQSPFFNGVKLKIHHSKKINIERTLCLLL